MKNGTNGIFMLAAILGLCACACAPAPKESPEFDTAALFGADGCLRPDVAKGYASDMKCLDPNGDGCVTRAEWESVMNHWRTHTPAADRSLCDQMPGK